MSSGLIQDSNISVWPAMSASYCLTKGQRLAIIKVKAYLQNSCLLSRLIRSGQAQTKLK